MSFNGSGTFVINTAGQPVVANTVISATVFNALTADLATGLSTCITKDGQTTITANIPFGSNKITGLGAATAATDAATLGQVQSTAAKLITVTGTDTITGTMSPALTAYAAGQLFYFIANAANTGAMTINIDGLGAKAITRDGSTALIAGDVNTGEIVVICYDGTRFQMINAANSFGNTTINGTLTVTGNTGLQANVSITSTLSVGGTFAVTGAATLGSTLSVTGKSDLPVVSTASMNAAVAVITTGTVTNLTSTSASIASMNAGVALLTNATVTTLTATGASIASANIGNLQFTAASIASINAGVAVITNLTATSASIASMNAGVALLTTATVTNLTATGASIASANAGNLQVTGASVASANVGVALITTGTVTALTATGASVASANVGTAVVTGLTVTNASIASANAGTATLSGNLTLNGGTANGVLYLNASKVATSGSALTFTGTRLGIGEASPVSALTVKSGNGDQATLNNAGERFTQFTLQNNGTSKGALWIDNTNSLLELYGYSGISLTFSANGTEQMRLTSTGLGIGTSSPLARLTVSDSTATNGTMTLGNNASYNGTLQYIFSTGELRISQVGGTSLGTTFYTGGSERMRIENAGNVGIGTSSPDGKLDVAQAMTNGSTGAFTTPHLALTATTSTDTTGFVGMTMATSDSPNYGFSYGALRSSGGVGDLVWRNHFNSAAGTELLRLTYNGNLGLGVSPSAWGSNYKAMEFGDSNNQAFIYGQTNADVVSMGVNAYNDNTDYKYKANGYASFYLQYNGEHRWNTAASGTAGNTITFTQAMTLNADGELLIGTTSDAGAFKLQVAGDALMTGGNALYFRDTGAYAFSPASNVLAFSTNSVERARITSGGNFLINNTSATDSKLIVTAAGTSSAAYMVIFADSNGSTGLYVRNDGLISTGTLTLSPYNNTTGSAANVFVSAAGELARSTSSLRYKTDVQNATHGLAEVLALRPVTYKGINDGDKVFGGLIAEEVHDAGLTEFVAYDAEGQPDALHYGNMVSLLTKAIQEQQAMINDLKAKVAALESK